MPTRKISPPVFVIRIVDITLNIVHNESGSTWDGIYTKASFAWTALIFLYNAYVLAQMYRSGSLFNPEFFLGGPRPRKSSSKVDGGVGVDNPMFGGVQQNPLFDGGDTDGGYLDVGATTPTYTAQNPKGQQTRKNLDKKSVDKK